MTPSGPPSSPRRMPRRADPAPKGNPALGRRRRPTGVLLAGVIVVILAGNFLGEPPTPADSRTQLARVLANGTDPARFALDYRRGGTRVLDCVLANVSYSAEVDLPEQRMLVRTQGSPEPTVLVAGAAVYLHRSLFADPPFPGSWLRVTRPAEQRVAAALRRVLGPDLARDVTGERLPASGNAIAREALAVAATVERQETDSVTGTSTEKFRVEVDPARFRDAAAAGSTPPEPQDDPTPVFDVWVGARGDVVRLAVSARRPDGTPAPPEEGWTVEYRPFSDVQISTPPPSDVTDWSAVENDRLAAAPRDCRLPS